MKFLVSTVTILNSYKFLYKLFVVAVYTFKAFLSKITLYAVQ